MHRHSRVPLYAFAVAILGLVVAVTILFMLVLSLKAARDREAQGRQAQINSAICSVIGQFPSGENVTLDRVRVQLHCPPVPAA